MVGPSGERLLPAADFFALPQQNPARENVLGPEEALAEIQIPAARAGMRSTYHKIMDREAWTHAVVSAAIVLEMDKDVCRSARIVLGGVAPIPWRLPEVERMLVGQRITEALAAKAAETALEGARPLAKNAYKVPLTKGVIRRTLLALATRA
jgi:xanthine dehydrogenase YagS FAD-binding subunit